MSFSVAQIVRHGVPDLLNCAATLLDEYVVWRRADRQARGA